MASRLGNLALVQDMLDHLDESRIQDQFDVFNRENWKTPLHEAAQNGKIDFTEKFFFSKLICLLFQDIQKS